MKKLLLVILAIQTSTGILAQPSVAQADGKIIVVGNAEISVTPDIIVWTVGVNTDDPDLQIAKKVNDEHYSAVMEVSGRIVTEHQDVKAGPVRIDRMYTRNEHGGIREFSHYSVRRTIKITQSDFKEFEKTLDALINSAEIELRFRYEISNEDSILEDLRLRALDSAKEKAKAMVERLDGELVSIIEISEFPPVDKNARSIGIPAPPHIDGVSPEARTLSVSVFVTFSIK